jgi:hypothetical protein
MSNQEKEHDQKVCIILDEKIVGLWNFHMKTPEGDYLAAIRELERDVKYELTYRFRYYKDDKVWDSKDEKHWCQGTLSGTRHYAVSSFQMIVNMLAKMQGSPTYEVLMDEKGLDDFMRRVEALPSMFMREGKR